MNVGEKTLAEIHNNFASEHVLYGVYMWYGVVATCHLMTPPPPLSPNSSTDRNQCTLAGSPSFLPAGPAFYHHGRHLCHHHYHVWEFWRREPSTSHGMEKVNWLVCTVLWQTEAAKCYKEFVVDYPFWVSMWNLGLLVIPSTPTHMHTHIHTQCTNTCTYSHTHAHALACIHTHTHIYKRFYLQRICPKISRLFLFGFGFQWIHTRGELADSREAPILVVAPHSSLLDTFVIGAYHIPTYVGRTETRRTPIFGCKWLQSLVPVPPHWVKRMYQGHHLSVYQVIPENVVSRSIQSFTRRACKVTYLLKIISHPVRATPP